MATVKHLLNLFKSIHGNGEVSLLLRRRSFCARSIYSIDKLNINEILLNFNCVSRQIIQKKHYNKAFKEEKLVEVISILYYLRFKSDEMASSQKVTEVKPLELQNILNPDLLKMFPIADWTKKVTSYVNKNLSIKKQADHLNKRKLLHLLKESKFYTSQVYEYSVYKSKVQDLPKTGKVCVNILGISFFSQPNFRNPEVNLYLHEVLEFEQKGARMRLKFLIQKEVRTAFLEMRCSRQFCEDLASNMVIGLRENRYYFYSYNYVARMLPPNMTSKDKVEVEQLHGQKISRCNEFLNNNGDNLVSYSELGYTTTYLQRIPPADKASIVYYYPFKKSDLARDPKNASSKKTKPLIKATGTSILRKRETELGGAFSVSPRDPIDSKRSDESVSNPNVLEPPLRKR